MHQLKSLALYLFYHHRENLLLRLFILGQKDQPGTVLSFFRHRNTLQQNKLMGNLDHDACTVARLVARLGTSMLHVLQHLKCIVYQFVAFPAMNIHNHSHAACVVFIVRLVEPFLCTSPTLFHLRCLKFAICHIILTFTYTLSTFGCKGNSKCRYNQTFAYLFGLKNLNNLLFACFLPVFITF